MSNNKVLRLMLLSLLATACEPPPGPNDTMGDGGGADAAAPLDYRAYVARSIEIGCVFLYECCDAGERSALGANDADVEACMRAHGDGLTAATEATERAIADGGAIYDAALAARCLDDLDSASCETRSREIGRVDGECIDVIRGVTPIGGDCSSAPCSDALCANDLCEPYPLLGEPCIGVQCAGDAVCIEGTCALPHAAGGSCERDLDCERGLICRGTCVVLDRCLGE
jgi:hypothetical protein